MSRMLYSLRCLFSFCLIIASMSAIADDSILRVWGPKVHETRSDAQVPLIRIIAEKTGRKVDFNVSLDTDALLEACAHYQVDHALLEQGLAKIIIKQYGYQAIASGEITVSLFTRKETSRDLNKLRKIAYVNRTGARRIALNEQDINYLGDKLEPFDTFQRAAFALLNDEVDGLISNDRLVTGLTKNLRKQIHKRFQFSQTAGALFIVSPLLDRTTIEALQDLYLSDDPVITDLFYHRAGLQPIQKIPLDSEDTNIDP